MLFIALGGIGLPGAAVYLRTSFMTPTRRTLVSLAGPAANLVLAVLLLTLTRLYFDTDHAVLWAGVAFLGFLQIMAVVLNLLPSTGPGRLRRPGAAPEPGDTARGGAGQAVRRFRSGIPALRGEPLALRVRGLAFRVLRRAQSAGDLRQQLTRFWSQWF